MKNKLKELAIPFLSVLIALVIGGGVIIYLGENPLTAYGYLFGGAFGSDRGIARTMLEATPMIFSGLAIMFAYQAGMFNIGAQGQVVMGGLAAAAVGAFVNNHFINNVYVVVLIAAIAGFLWAAIAGYLKAKLGVHEVISTIMLNYIASNFEQYCLNYPLKEGGPLGPTPQTPPVMEISRLPLLLPDSRVYLNVGFIIALVAVVVVWFIFNKTVFGYEIKAVGFNFTAAENAGINAKKILLLTLGISGLLAGLAGAERVLGGVGQYTYRQGLMAEYGFDGIAVALLGKNTPIGVLISAFLFATLRVGGRAMQFNTSIPSQIIIIIQAVIILLIASENMLSDLLKKFKKKEAKA
ncbi:simple sugar transport system permease protein [Hypnocyclicus thermotrophus]|uniref:Simple sugar transport system permease protein n=1 Tax=Hypnocyclicus thermotrophus TaxID=1627895 RepID=A0AA46I6K8_9FUSO|nr:ABC transporter permease [Hypnocyclicus thermotrophus]TDT72462.1 simple sugar transport system permease protein [Hypnocyclicus thermotrophus]